jgi:hypothetical protein
VVLRTLLWATLLGVPPVAVVLRTLPEDLGTLLVVTPVITSVVVTFPAFAKITAAVVVVASWRAKPSGFAFIGEMTHLARIALL